jgi:membrane protein YqaA with SNARE-associated domain
VKEHLQITKPNFFIFRFVRWLYDWTLHWANTKYATVALAINAFAESSFFPVAPDVLLIAMGIAKPKRAIWYAFICTISSVLGGILGYLIGLKLMEVVGWPILEFYGYTDTFEKIEIYFKQYEAWAVGIAGLTPIPYKVFTIAGGAFQINFLIFCLASTLSRGLRFFVVSFLVSKFGPPVKTFIDKYFNLLTILFVILLLGGFVLLKYIV